MQLSTQIGSVRLPNPVMTASGTAGLGTELGAYVDLADLGAFVAKSLSAEPWAGNPAPRLSPTVAGMINSVGLQNPGVETWVAEHLPCLVDTGARVVASIWGRTVDEFAKAAAMLEGAPGVVACEVNVSCPNLEDNTRMFAHTTEATAAAVGAARECELPLWAKLSPTAPDLVDIAEAAAAAGAEAVTLINTLPAMVIDPETGRPVLGAGGGGLSGEAIRPVAVRAVYDVRAAHSELPIVGVGGIATARHAVEFFAAGAAAVQVGTASFADPRASTLVRDDLEKWFVDHGTKLNACIGIAHSATNRRSSADAR